jgi:hypothetical protein
MPKSATNDTSCSTAAMMRRPPDAPATIHGLSPLRRITGNMLVSGLLPGAIELGWPGRGSNHITPLFMRMPVFGNTTRLPIEESSVVVMATIFPSASHTEMCVVQLSAACGSASPSVESRRA